MKHNNSPLTGISRLIRKHTGFDGALALVKSARHPYRPTIRCHTARLEDRGELLAIADFYDLAMLRQGRNKEAYRC